MDIDVQPGRFVVAVSGGVDSMVLLDLLRQEEGLDLIVAHFDHGIRSDSAEDRRLVEETAKRHGLPFAYEEGGLGPQASEALARGARYDFLERVRQVHGARAIITAHHQDDLLETAILNLLRGTGRKGLTALANRPGIVRPLLRISKQEIRDYAEAHHIEWREDSTNSDDRYLRNYIRQHLLPQFDAETREELLRIIERVRSTNNELDEELQSILAVQSKAGTLDRHYLMQLPHSAAKELLASWLRARNIRGFDAYTLERISVAAKTQQPGAIIDVLGGAYIKLSKDNLALERHER